MKVAAIIAEYNPFHSGHALHISRTRQECGATHVVAIMSGDFVQRGDAACADKFTRAKMALRCGADLVVELPLPWAMAGAETFARGGVGIAAGLGCVDVLSFGSECGNTELIQRTARLSDGDEANASLREYMSSGMSFAAARAKALENLDHECAALLSSPNDTLGVEYCRSIGRIAPGIQPFCVRRVGAAHDSQANSGDQLPFSASYLRRRLADRGEGALNDLAPHMPSEAFEILSEAVHSGLAPADISRLDRMLIMKLRAMTAEQLTALPDVSEGLEFRISQCAAEISGRDAGFASLCDRIKCKRYTHARIRRVVLSALLGLTAEDSAGIPPYIRVLAMGSRGKDILAHAGAHGTLPVITRFSQVAGLDARAVRIFNLGTQATDIYGLTLPEIPEKGAELTRRLIVERK